MQVTLAEKLLSLPGAGDRGQIQASRGTGRPLMRRMKLSSLIPAAALLAALTLVSTDALAWGAQGHRLVGRVAETRLTRAARAEVDRLAPPGETDPTLSGIAP